MYKIIQLIGIPDRLYHKLLLIMRLTTVILIASLVQVSASTFGQRLSLQRKGITLEQVFKEIRNQTGYDILLSTNEVKVSSTIDADFKNETIEEVMNRIVSGRGLTYSIEDKTILLKKKEPSFLDRLAERWAAIDVRGRVLDETGKPMPGATIQIRGKVGTHRSNEKGEFSIKDVADDAVLIISYVGYKQLELPLKDAAMPLEIKLNVATGELEEVKVVQGSTGYQRLNENFPGSFDVIDNELLNRSYSSNILDRIKDLTPGMLFGKTTNGQTKITIRGTNTLAADPAPLIVLDNFPYNGDINNINPNDVENITVLKDAASASIWGARAGNGVIVITTKKGKNAKPSVSVVSTTAFTEKSDLFNENIISSADYIELEKFLFDKGAYNPFLGTAIRRSAPVTPVVELLNKVRTGALSQEAADQQINAMKENDVRDDLQKYFYRTGLRQSNSMNISGGSAMNSYYISGGWDKTIPSDRGGYKSNRISLKASNNYKVTKDLEFEAGLTYTRTASLGGNPSSGDAINSGFGKQLYPYADLVDDNGNALVLVKGFRTTIADAMTDPNLLDWKYRPYDEIDAKEDRNKLNDFVINTAVRGGYKSNRISLKASNNYKVTKDLEFEAGLTYTRTASLGGNPSSGDAINSGFGKQLYPYADLVDDNGNALVLVKGFRTTIADAMTDPNLLDWKYRPYDEIDAKEDRNKLNDFVINTAVRYNVFPGFKAEINYQFQNQVTSRNNLTTLEDFTTRDQINKLYQPDAAIKFPVPKGGIMTSSNNELLSHNARVSLTYNKSFNKHQVSSMAGWEITSGRAKGNIYKYYGYNEEGSAVASNIDFRTPFLEYRGFTSSVIPIQNAISETLQRMISTYFNATYNYDGRYTVYFSLREDAANILGVKARQRGRPFWSVGSTWTLSSEPFYKLNWLPRFSMKASYGFSGNYNSNATAYAVILTPEMNEFNILHSGTVSYPVQDLDWERAGRMELGIDFGLKDEVVSGSIRYYKSSNKDLMAQASLDPTLGYPNSGVVKNVGAISGNGLELSLNIDLIRRPSFGWKTYLTFSSMFSKLTKLTISGNTQNASYVGAGGFRILDKPLSNLYSYKWSGLDPENGNPRGILNGEVSTNYLGIQNSRDLSELVYHGQTESPYYGNILNMISWKSISLSFNINYRTGHYFRRKSIQYQNLLNYWSGHGDYALRWKAAGDEKLTNVPSFSYPFQGNDGFYANSDMLVAKADHIRLNDLNIGYTFNRTLFGNLFKNMRLYANASNLNLMLWTANNLDIDPEFDSVIKPGRVFSFGLNASF